ncbi:MULTISPECIES: AAA family ATPase [Actinomycetes]|uniref:AAA family ATPase n=1 Tax=Actinomycetes TaxID=1760 RepID=UPI000B00DC46|nr:MULTISPECIES: AAA family ATPase [Actinomycetes]
MELQEAINEGLHQCSDTELATNKAMRESVATRFPLADWPTLDLNRYALGTGTSKQSFSYALETATKQIGSISGGSAYKFGIFYHNDGDWKFPKNFATLDKAWSSIRSDFAALFDLAAAGEWGEAATHSVTGVWSLVVLKALHIYFPDEIFPVFAGSRLRHYARALGIEPDQSPIALNRALNAALQTYPELSSVDGFQRMILLEGWRPPSERGRGNQTESSVYLKVAPGEQASAWQDCLEGEYICIGWDELGDLSLYDTFDEFSKAFARTYPQNTDRQNLLAAKNIWKFRNLKPGNHVVANRGTAEILGVGTVLADGYQYLPERDQYQHTVAVDWDTTHARKLDPGFGGWRSTFQTLKAKDVARILETDGADPAAEKESVELPDYTDAEEVRYSQWAKALERKKQLILYGPPGTGKTYSAVRFARWYGEQNSDGPTPGTVTPVTFHASYTYEEFVEGYRPIEDASNAGGLRLARTDGIFKLVCADAAKSPEKTFFLIIDEINRANLPRVFGELMTVIEADKRGTEVLLPTSQKPFSVPENLFIIGTMNTADRSIRTLDAALRRRFAFEEILPDSSVLEGQASYGSTILALDLFLDDLNKRITDYAGRDRQIGHAYFMHKGEPISDPVDFAQVVRLEVIPLLQELAHDDYAQLAQFLGQSLVDAPGQRLVPVDDEQLVDLLAAEYGVDNPL